MIRALVLLVLVVGSLPALELGWIRERHVVIDGGSVRAIVPARVADAVDPLVRRADVLYRTMADDAGYEIDGPLWLWFGADTDLHNGFSTVIPFPLIQVELAQARPDQRIFGGGSDTERTLIHELAHHIANDRNRGFRNVLESIFGRVLPNDLLSTALVYFSWPPHVFQPAFWQEGFAVWAETAYADPDAAFAGRGRDPLTHMVWRLDAADGRIPPVGDWRLTLHRWPYGGSAYIYGTAYLRYLAGSYDIDPWRLLDDQTRQWPFVFEDGSERRYDKGHSTLIAEARTALLREQRALIEQLRERPVTATDRLTPPDSLVGAPAWRADGSIAVALNGPYHRPRIHHLDPASGELDRSGLAGHFQPNLRTTPDGHLVTTVYDHRGRARTRVIAPDGRAVDFATTGTQADLLPRTGSQIATVDLDERLQQRIHVWHFGKFANHPERLELPETRGACWSPTWRPCVPTRELLWVECDEEGSRLVLMDLDRADSRRVLLRLPGRILHPCWTPDGEAVFFCADHTGIANAYHLAVADAAAPRPVTHVLGGVIACVPSPDGRHLAVVDHDVDGPFLALLDADPASWAEGTVSIATAWPAPSATPGRQGVRTVPQRQDDDQPPLPQRPYRGLLLLRPRFWTPTTAPVPAGGFGVIGVATDPLATHVLTGGAGVGPQEYEPVGLGSWVYRGWPLDIGVIASRQELTYGDEVVAADGDEFDYTETVTSHELLVGRGIAALDRGFFAFARFGLADWEAVDDAEDEYADETIVRLGAFEGEERYVQVDLGYDDRFLYPDGFAPDAGVAGLVSLRHSGFDGELERDRVLVSGSAAVPVWRAGGHQIHVTGRLGWSDGDEILQGSFSIGGAFGLGLPRGYLDREVSGEHLLAGGLAYRLPLWRPFHGLGSAPFVHRGLILEGFFDAGKVSSDRPGGDGEWFRSTGGLLYSSWEFWNALIQPGLGVAVQLDGDEDTTLLFDLGFRW